MKFRIIILLTILFASQTIAQDVSVDARVDSTDIYIGDHVIYTVNIEQPRGISFLLPQFTDSLYESIEILSQTPVDTVASDGETWLLEKKYTITSFDTGFYQIPPYYIEYETESGKKRFYSDYVPLRVKRVDIAPADSTDVIFDIIGPEKVGYSAGEIIPWVLLVAALIAGTWFLIRYRPWRRKPEETEESRMPDEPIHIITFRELDKLEKKKLWQAGKVKEYYSQLTDIIRFYIELRYGVIALEMTTEEITRDLSKYLDNESVMSLLAELLKNADLSKFAKYTHDPVTNESSLEKARKFVSDTYIEEPDDSNTEKDEEEGKEVSDE